MNTTTKTLQKNLNLLTALGQNVRDNHNQIVKAVYLDGKYYHLHGNQWFPADLGLNAQKFIFHCTKRAPNLKFPG